ncbi:phage tail protein [Leifsonia sp. NPDC058230]|uniref:phage tail protein n=1 Tax=Leifsonia sp. NPDC058230 TaxID=3346391 RepID=UPI0036D7A05C
MSEPYLGEIRLLSFGFAPKGWALCNGQLLPISQNAAIFSLIGTFYGGNGVTEFALPDLRGRIPLGVGNGHNVGESGGEPAHALTLQEMPLHTHLASPALVATGRAPAGSFFAAPGKVTFGASPAVAMNPATVSSVGGNQPHPNMPPYMTLSFAIALQGVFPSRT